ncbi:WG repeat-containing protein [Spirosoma luteum]|uniref:WG repeat-containing protein n=1 Tax=Spirosoma luteum TaxID=431553 RepID=UPI000367F13E|nr:WG repeat-containing protein [Spirosoma luteum]
MTETELTDRLREAIVLDGPDAWKTNSYLQDAQQAGISLTDALKRASEISQEVAGNKLLFQNIQARITRLAQPSRSPYVDQDLNQIVNAASSLKLSPDFVKNQWVPTVLKRLAAASAPGTPEPTPVFPVPKPVPAVPELTEVPQVSKTTASNSDEVIKQEIESPKPAEKKETSRPPEPFVPPIAPKPVVLEHTIPEPAPVVRSFTAVPARVHKGQPVTLAWEVENLLAVTIDDLGEGLSPKNRGWVKPSKSTDYTLFDVNNNPLSTVRVEVIPRDRSGVYGVLFALVLLAIIYWFIKSSNANSNAPTPTRKTDQTSQSIRQREPYQDVASDTRQEPNRENSSATTTESPVEPTDAPDVALSESPKKKGESTDIPVKEETQPEPEVKPATPADARQGKYEEAFGNKPYDKAELGADEQGWRRARSNGRWGYINEADEWVIRPEFEAVTPFRNNTASAFLNGQLITINRNGEQVRN